MRILYCLDGTFNSGGKERIITTKANYLARKGHSVAILTCEQKGRPDFFPLINVKRYDADALFSESSPTNPFKRFLEKRKKLKILKHALNKTVEEFKPDVLISTFGYDLPLVPKLKDKSLKIAETHFTRWFRLYRNRKGIWRMIDLYLSKKDYKNARKFDKLVCLTKEDKDNWKGLENHTVIYNFIEHFPLSRAKLENKEIISVGRLSYQKGYDRLIQAWKLVNERHPDWKLSIYGSGSLKNELLSQIENLGLSHSIRIMEPVSNIGEKYLASSALVMSSRYEGMPMVLLEGMSYGLPLISFACKCGPKDLIKTDFNGILVPEGDIRGLAEAIIKIIENPEYRNKLGENAFNDAKKYSVDSIMEEWNKLFEVSNQ